MTALEFIEIISNTTWYYGPRDPSLYDEECDFFDHTDLPLYDDEIQDIYEIRFALLQALNSTGELRTIYDEIVNDPKLYEMLPGRLRVIIKNVLDPKTESEVSSHRNESINLILNLFNDKKGGMVTYARKQLIDRFDGQSYSCQKKILISFLNNGNANDRAWAAKRLYDDWDKTFSEPIKTAWEKYNEKSVGITALKYLPESYTVKQIHQFEQAGLERKYIFAKLGNVKDFPYEISLDTLTWIDYFYVMAKLGRPVQEETAREIMLTQLSLASKRHYEEKYRIGGTEDLVFGHGITSYQNMGLLIWSFGQLGLSSTLCLLFDIAKKAHSFGSFDEYEYSLNLNHLLVGEERPLPLFGDLWAEPSLYEDE